MIIAEQNLKERKIMCLSDSVLGITGYGTVTKDLFNRIHHLYDIKNISWNYTSQPLMPPIIFEDNEKINFPIYPGGRMQYAQDRIIPYIRQFRPDIFWILLDSFMIYPFIPKMDLTPAKFIMYFPSDGEFFPLGCEAVLRKSYKPVAMSKFAQKQAKELFNIKTEYIPHGVNTNHYYPLSEKIKKGIKNRYGFKDKFVIGTVARNQGRKMMARTIKVFNKFAKGKNDVVLLLHTDPRDPAAVTNLVELIKRYGISHKCYFTGMSFFHGFTLQQMRELYNAMDVFMLSTSGEGWGIPTIEAMSCEVPVALTNYTTTKEIVIDWKQCGFPIKVQTELTGSWNVERGLCDIDDFSEKLNILYKDESLRKEFGKTGRQKCLKFYDWDRVIAPSWINLFNEILEE